MAHYNIGLYVNVRNIQSISLSPIIPISMLLRVLLNSVRITDGTSKLGGKNEKSA